MSWHITLLGKVGATREGVTLSHFESSRAVALLARLALFPRKTHPREELLELLWPEIEPEVARGRLRRALFSLRRQLEAGLPAGSVLLADRLSVGLNPSAVTTDVAAFEQAVRRRDDVRARQLYQGELLPGLWDEWIVEERHRLEALAENLPNSTLEITAPEPSSERARQYLPPYLTTYFGRERERAELMELVGRHRLVTITGLGGTGKTRIAVELVQPLSQSFQIIAFVALAESVAPSQILGRACQALGLPASEASPLEQLSLYLSEKATLLVLDNLEQLVDAGGSELIEQLLARLPQLTCLVTSRRALAILGERLYPLAALPEPTSVALFLDRIQAIRPGFQLTDGNHADVEAVCQGLEGIPLALELAASRLRAFSVSEMRRELQSRFDWLARTGLKGGKEDRHRSLTATLEWSWRLLPVAQQQFLAGLSLFRGGWESGQAQAVLEQSDARERLESLVADSLVLSEESAQGRTRLSMLETVREFVAPRLENPQDARHRFREHFLAQPTHDENTVVAWEYALEDSAADHAYALAEVHFANWLVLIGSERASALLERTLRLPAINPRLRLRAQHQLAILLQHGNSRPRALALMDEALAAAPEELRAEALMIRSHVGQFDEPTEQTLARLDQCLALTSDPVVRAEALRIKGCALTWSPNFESAELLFAQAEQLYPKGHRGLRALLLHRAQLANRQEKLDRALLLYQQCAEQALLNNDLMLYNLCRQNQGEILTRLGRWEEALAASREGLRIAEQQGDRMVLLVLIWNIAWPISSSGQAQQATLILSGAVVHWEREIAPLTAAEREELDGLRRDLIAALGESHFSELWKRGQHLTLKEVLALAQGT